MRGRERRHAARRAIENRDSFLAMLGHELRNPLSAIALALEVVTIGNERGLDVIRQQTSQLTHLVNDLLNVSRQFRQDWAAIAGLETGLCITPNH